MLTLDYAIGVDFDVMTTLGLAEIFGQGSYFCVFEPSAEGGRKEFGCHRVGNFVLIGDVPTEI